MTQELGATTSPSGSQPAAESEALCSELLLTTKHWKQPKCPSGGGQDKQNWKICTANYYLVTKKISVSSPKKIQRNLICVRC